MQFDIFGGKLHTVSTDTMHHAVPQQRLSFLFYNVIGRILLLVALQISVIFRLFFCNCAAAEK